MEFPIIIAGAAGFIGSHVSERLLTTGCQVVGLDNYYTGSKSHIDNLLKHKYFKALTHNIMDPLYIETSAIYNFASPASPKDYQSDPIYTIKTNFLGSLNLLGLAKRTKARILQASTSEIYGDPSIHPQEETYFGNVNPIGIRACYDEGKRSAETLFFDYHRQHQVKIKVARIFNTYGPRMNYDDGRAVPNFIVQVLKGEPITIYGNGNQTRSFCYIDDLVDGLIKLMNSEDSISGPINLGAPHEVTILEIAETIYKLIGKKTKFTFLPPPPDDPVRRKPNIAEAITKLRWEPKVSLEDGLKETIAYFKALLNE